MNSPSQIDAASKRRNSSILQAGLSAIVSKGLMLLVNALSIPIVIRHLGTEQFGIWITISTSVTLLILLDLGVSNAITNRLSEAYARDDRELAGHYATTGLFLMVLVAAALGLIAIALWPYLNWGALFHLSNPSHANLVAHAVALAYAVFLCGLPAGLAARFLGGYQETRTVNIVGAIGAVANLVAIVIVALAHGGLTAFVAASSGTAVVTNLGCLAWLLIWHKPWLMPTMQRWRYELVGSLLRSGSEFFVLQIAGLIVFNSDNFVIAHYLGPQQVAPYSVTWRLVGYAGVLQVLLTPALWPAYAEAWARGDLRWIQQTLTRVMAATMTVAATACLILVLWGRIIIRFWAGPAAVPSKTLLVLMCLWILISTFMANTVTALAATNNGKLQAWLALLAAGLNLAASVWLVQRIGSIGVIVATIGSYVLILIGPQIWKTRQVLWRPSRNVGDNL